MTFAPILLLATLLTGSWNIRWFPSDRAEHRGTPRMERARTQDAADHIRKIFFNSAATNCNRVLFLQEMRDATVTEELVRTVSTNWCVASVSEFRERDGRLGWQQLAIATDLPVLESGWKPYRYENHTRPPRGFTYAVLQDGRQRVVCVCLHLKSDYGAGKDEALRRLNARKRRLALQQIARFLAGYPGHRRLVGGDFNSEDKALLEVLTETGLRNCWSVRTVTHFRGYALDHLFQDGYRVEAATTIPDENLSDHALVFFRLIPEAAPSAASPVHGGAF